MNMYDRQIKTSRIVKGVSCRNVGCHVSVELAEPDRDKEQQRIRREAEKAVEQRMAEKVDKIEEHYRTLTAKMQQRWSKTLIEMQEEVKRQLVELSIKIAEKILDRELPDGEMLKKILEETLAPVSDLQGVRVRMSPVDAKIMQGAAKNGAERWQRVEVLEDNALKRGDVLIESRNGYFDGSIHERLSYLAEALLSYNGAKG